MAEVDVARLLSATGFTVLWSGGLDSTAALLWALDNVPHDDWDILYVEVTGNTHPLASRYVRRVAEKLGVAGKLRVVRRGVDFFDALERWGVPPPLGYRWCMHHFKVKLIAGHARPVQVTGVRRADSARRRGYRSVEYVRFSRSLLVHPLLDWDDGEVRDYLASHGVPPNPCYRLCGHSGNCMFCPFHSKRQILGTLAQPGWREKILAALVKARCGGGPSCGVKKKWLSLAAQRLLTDYAPPLGGGDAAGAAAPTPSELGDAAQHGL